MKNTAALAQVQRSLTDSAGGYLRNTVHIPGQTCSMCRGTQMRDGYHTCYPCDRSYGGCADLVGSMIYGVDGFQSGRLMFGYKSTAPGPSHRQTLRSLVALALRGHVDCASALVGVRATCWATVPSLKHISAAHPFREILLSILSTKHEIEVVASKAAANKTPPERRELDPTLYELRTAVAKGMHVMVIDDTWTKGGHAQSVALALKQAGAGKVSILAVARWLNMDDERTKRVYREHIRDRPYDPAVCPWTADACPPFIEH